MRLPSIIKTPKHQRFNFEPRYYDPIKEEIDGKRERVRRILKADQKGQKASAHRATRLEGAFTTQFQKADNSGFLRLIIGFILFAGVVAYLYFGDIAVYVTVSVVIAFYFYRKLRSR